MGIKRIHDLATAGIITGAELLHLEQGGIDCQVSVSSLLTFGKRAGEILVNPSGVAATDTANFVAADILSGSTLRSVTGATDQFGFYRTVFGSGTFTVNANAAMMNPSNLAGKARGRIFEGRGKNLTAIVYNAPAGSVLCQNQYWQNVQMYGFTLSCSAGNDFYWGQEQAGLSSIQHNRYEELDFQGTGWNNGFRYTGFNNNSEMLYHRIMFGQCGQGIYVPALTASVVTASSNQIAITNSPVVAQIGDTCQLSATVGTGGGALTAGTRYYVVAATSTYISVSATAGGAAITPNGSGTPSINFATDQFLNHTLSACQADPGTSNSELMDLGYGGSVSLIGCDDVSGWQPTSPTYLINLRAGASGVKSRGSCSFIMDKLRVEHRNDNALLLNCNWPFGNVLIKGYDGSSTLNTATTQYMQFTIGNNSGPTVHITDSQIPGQIGVTYGSNAYKYAALFHLTDVQPLQQDASQLIVATGTNTGGTPAVIVENWGNNTSSDTTGYTPVSVTTPNWHLGIGNVGRENYVNITGPNSDGPLSGAHTIPVLFPAGCAITRIQFWKPANSNTGAFNYQIQTMEAVPTVLFGGTGTPMQSAGSAGTQINLYEFKLAIPFEPSTTLARQLVLFDALGRAGVFTNFRCLVYYIG